MTTSNANTGYKFAAYTPSTTDDTNQMAQLVAALEDGDLSDSGLKNLLELAAKYPNDFRAWMVRR